MLQATTGQTNFNQAFFSEERGRTRAGYSTPLVAIEEFQVNTSNYSSEYGRSAGGVINTVTKGGDKNLHGGAFYYDGDNKWGATNPFTTITTQTSPGVFTSNPYKPADVRKRSGFGIGGPFIKDKLFWNVSFDWLNRNFPGTGIASNPGVFFAPLSAANATTLSGRLGVTSAQATDTYNNDLNNLISMLGPVARTGEQYIILPKIDWNVNQKNHASFVFNRMRWASPAGIQTQATNTFGIASFGNDYVRDTWGVAKLDTFFTTTLSNEARYQYGRDFEFQFAQPPTAFELANFVNPPGYTNPLGLPPDVFISNGFDMGVPTFLQRPAFPDERRNQFADTVTWIHGKHNLKFGVDYNHVHDNSQNLRFQFGSFSYSNLVNFTSDFFKPDSCGTAHNTACYSSFQQAFGPLGFQFATNDIAFFAEDSWRILPRLTLTVGLRYDDEILPSPFSNLVNPDVPQTAHLPSDTNNFGPRIGFAWDVFGNGKTSLRGGYGIYYGRIINSALYSALSATGNPNGQLSFFISPPSAGAPNPAAPLFPQILATSPTPGAGLNAVFFDPHFQAPQVHEVDLSIERQLGWNTLLSVSYMGSFGRSLPDFVDTNIAPSTANITYTVVNADTDGSGPLANGSTITTPLFTKRKNSALGALTAIFSGISSNYNALVVQVNRRMTNHVQFGANYTW